jgi:hypothetical protein
VRPERRGAGWGDVLELAMSEWHVGAHEIVTEWSFEMLFLYMDRLAARKKAIAKQYEEQAKRRKK